MKYSFREGFKGSIEIAFLHALDELGSNFMIFEEEVFRKRVSGLIDQLIELVLGSLVTSGVVPVLGGIEDV